jgi:hypothetical protein
MADALGAFESKSTFWTQAQRKLLIITPSQLDVTL